MLDSRMWSWWGEFIREASGVGCGAEGRLETFFESILTIRRFFGACWVFLIGKCILRYTPGIQLRCFVRVGADDLGAFRGN